MNDDMASVYSTTTMNTTAKEMKLQQDKLYVLDGKRAQNIIIGLTQFKPSTIGEGVNNMTDIVTAIMNLNQLNGKLDLDRLNNFAVLLPSDTEIRKLQACHETQNKAELFIKELIPFYPLLARRLETFIICQQFESEAKSLLEKMNKIIFICIKVSYYELLF